ncbi:type II secretion system F family protein [Marinomonas fungiae]|uniref:type II secretion system F family protein n=1 Tax=Marinomonas fungiae TaxID=1137284 RepID=UPI003A913677
MLDDYSNSTFILSLSSALYIVLVVSLFFKKTKRSQGLSWLQAETINSDRKKKSLTVRLVHFVRGVFSSSEAEMQRKFVSAGFYNTRFAVYFLPGKYFLLITGLLACYWLSIRGEWRTESLILISSLWLVFTIIIPDAYLATRAKSLQKRISEKLPYLIDLLAVCVQTGMTIEAAMEYLSAEVTSFDKDLGYLLNKTNDRTQIIGLEQALKELYDRVPTNEMRSFVMTLNQSLQYGTSIYGVLTTLSFEIREVHMLGLEEKIGKLAAKMSVPLILFIMMPVVILVAAPGVMRILYG